MTKKTKNFTKQNKTRGTQKAKETKEFPREIKKTKTKSPVKKTAVKKTTVNKTTKPEKPALTKEQEDEIRQLMTEQLVGLEYAPVSHDTLSKSITYVTAGNGLFKVRKTPIAIFKEQIAEVKDENFGLPKMTEGVELAIPKLPFRYLIEALSFYRDIYVKDKTEASVLYFYNTDDVELPDIPAIREDNKIITYVPEQENSKALSDFKDDVWAHWLRENTSLLLESHSHNDMSAFFSGTDDAHENNNQFYTVWGHVDKDEPMIAFRYVVGDKKVEVPATVLFEWPQMEEKIQIDRRILGGDDLVDNLNTIEESEVYYDYTEVKGPFKQIKYPDDWMAQHKKSAPATGYGNYYRGGGAKKKTRGQYGGYSDDSYNGYDDYYGSQFDDYYRYSDEKNKETDFEDVYEQYSFDELDNLEIFPSAGNDVVVSPGLHDVITNYLSALRTNESDVYDSFEF